jgi:hypothetical protein
MDQLPASVREEGAFLPTPLAQEIKLETRTNRLCGEGERELGRLNEAAGRMPKRNMMEAMAWVRDVQSTLGMTGKFESCRELLVSRLPDVDRAPRIDPTMARYLHADTDAVERVRRGEPVAETLLSRTAALLSEASTSGLDDRTIGGMDTPWRTGHHWLGGPDASDAFLLATPPDARLHEATAKWAAWVDDHCELPLIAKLAIGHYQLSVLAPVAASKHLASHYIVLELIRAEALQDQVLPISAWLDRDQAEYRRRLRAVVERRDIDGLVAFFAEGIRDLCRSQWALIRGLEDQRAKFIAQLPKTNDARARVVSALIGIPVFNIKLLSELSGVTARQTYNIVKDLVRLGLVRWLPKDKYGKALEVPDVVRLLTEYETLPVTNDHLALDREPDS